MTKENRTDHTEEGVKTKVQHFLFFSQRQTIELIPVTEVRYQYTGKQYLYYVYGMENKVHALDYPERYCCGCTII